MNHAGPISEWDFSKENTESAVTSKLSDELVVEDDYDLDEDNLVYEKGAVQGKEKKRKKKKRRSAEDPAEVFIDTFCAFTSQISIGSVDS